MSDTSDDAVVRCQSGNWKRVDGRVEFVPCRRKAKWLVHRTLSSACYCGLHARAYIYRREPLIEAGTADGLNR